VKLIKGWEFRGLTTSDHGNAITVSLLLRITVSDERLDLFEGTANLLFGDLGQVHDLTETTSHFVATACEEQAGGDEGVEAFAFADLVLDTIFVEMFGCLGH
jgi:hypothetical protein